MMNNQEKKFLRKIEKQAEITITKYSLLNKKEKVIVAVSGGKDSTAVLHILNKMGYNIHALTIDVEIGSYTKKNLENIKEFCSKEKIPLYVISVRKEFGCSICYIKSALNSKGMKVNSCAVCGVIRRYLLNKAAKELNAKKIVTGHNLDDEAQAVLMNFFRNTLQLSARLGPKTGINDCKGFVPRVKPLYFIAEKDIKKYSKLMKFPVNYERCPCAAPVYRNFVREMMNKYEKTQPGLKLNIISHFLELLPALKQKYKSGKTAYCTKCGEPSKGDVCRTCQIVSLIKTQKV